MEGLPISNPSNPSHRFFDQASQLHPFAGTSHINRTDIRRNAHGSVAVVLEVLVFEGVKIGTSRESFLSKNDRWISKLGNFLEVLKKKNIVSWWFQLTHLNNMLVNLDHLPQVSIGVKI